MFNIKELSEILPITYENKILDLISFEESEWYLNNCKRRYYNEFSDFDFNNDISEDKLREILLNMIISYKLKSQLPYEGRLILKDKCINQIIGGCTLLESNNNIVLSYFVVPDFQKQGIAYNMMHNIIKETSRSKMKFNMYELLIQSNNIASIRLAKKLHFKELCKQSGKFGINRKFYLERESIKNDI